MADSAESAAVPIISTSTSTSIANVAASPAEDEAIPVQRKSSSPVTDPGTSPGQAAPINSAHEQSEQEDSDDDSALGAGSILSETTSLADEITQYRYEHNRRYHAYKDGEYWGPNDDKQNNQLDIAHHLYLLTLEGRLHLAPIGDNPQNVLDVGTGTGIWAIDFADQYPSAQVIGFDLSPIQPMWVAPNVRFEINDACDPDWGYKKNSFDFIHVRAMYGSVADWPAFYRQALAHLAPGGWFQQIEMSVVPTSDDGTVTEGSIFDMWGKISLEAGDKFGKDLRIHEQIKGYLDDAGFEEVVEKVYKWPIGPWDEDIHMKQIGLWNQLHWEEGIEGWSLALLTRVLGWSYTEVQAYLGKMRTGIRDRKVHAYHIINVVYGRKPIPS
ncbi:hypothetical protein G7Y89_g11223 [Cudoniella acicularis]|uniref:S-adenosyl-L-methionine-dependent methyltransferase n=1 Tax=Cudoniella acicularis TaxID=354080 RepID=A0A8H4RB86_9HELO|nr:hypothetical protein G7Y89_g11223 [Cudoniella acicularis]